MMATDDFAMVAELKRILHQEVAETLVSDHGGQVGCRRRLCREAPLRTFLSFPGPAFLLTPHTAIPQDILHGECGRRFQHVQDDQD